MDAIQEFRILTETAPAEYGGTGGATIFGTKGKIIVDRQECKIYLHRGAEFETYAAGWTIRYITDLQAPVSYYLRGEEYSAQIDAFVDAIEKSSTGKENSFGSASETDRVINMIAAAGARSHGV